MTYSIPNKYNVFQEFYWQQNGVRLSYNDAVRLFYQMDNATEALFLQFYSDEVGYEITGDEGYFSVPSGYNLSPSIPDLSLVTPGCKTKRTKVQQSDGSIVWQTVTVSDWGNYTSAVTANAIHTKYTIQAYAIKLGIDIDSQWLVYSAEEILQMANEGVNIPQDVINLANTIVESSGSTYQTNGADEGDGEGEQTTEKETFLELVPKAEKHIDKCNDKREKIEDKISDLLNENDNARKSLFQRQKDKLQELQEYKEKLQEWRRLQDKVNNGEELTDSEARKYAEITGMLEDKNNSDDFQLNKNKIATQLNEINILAVLGEKIAEETIEMGETLADYTSKANYKSTRAQVSNEIGFLRAIFAMAHGKQVAKEAVETGNDTAEFTDETSGTMNDIAEILGVESMMVDPSAGEGAEDVNEPEGAKVAEVEAAEGTDDDASNVIEKDDETVQEEDSEKENDEQEEDFMVNDENVLALIDESADIHVDLAKEIKASILAIKDAKGDIAFAKRAAKFIDKMVAEYVKEEEERQREIEAKERENKEAQDRIDELKGGNTDDETKSVMENSGLNADEDENDNLSPEDKEEIKEKEALIAQNNSEIEQLQQDDKTRKEEFKAKTQNVKSKIDKVLPKENENFERDAEYRDEIIPEDTEILNMTESTGGTLFKMGKYRIRVGVELLMRAFLSHRLRKIALRHIVRGTKSSIIGITGKIVGKIPTDTVAEKATNASTSKEEEAITSLTEIDTKITSVTDEGEEDETEEVDDEEGTETEEGQGTDGQDNEEQVTTTRAAAAPISEDVTATPTTETQTTATTATAPATAAENTITRGVASQGGTTGTGNSAGDSSKDDATGRRRGVRGRDNYPGHESPNAADADTPAKTGGKKKKDEKEMNTDEAGSAVSDIKHDAKDSAKDSAHVKKDTEKDEKRLDKEAKGLQKQMKKDEKDVARMTKESLRAAKKQAEILVEYEQLTEENDEILNNEQKKKVEAPAEVTQVATQAVAAPGTGIGQTGTASSTVSAPAAQSTDSSVGSTTDNAQKLQENDTRIAILGAQFNMHGRKITRNRAKMVKLQKRTKTTNKKYNKKIKIKNQKIREAEKREIEKQKRLAKQLATVGVAENIFSITQATGAIMMLFPPTESAGLVLFNIGRYGLLACGLTKAIINLANGNTTAALIGLGQTAVSAALSSTGVGDAGSKVLTGISSGLQIVGSSAELYNNVRGMQGKEADGVMSKIGTIAGIASSVTSSAQGLTQLKGASFGQAVSAVGGAVGTALSATSQIMTEFGTSNEELAAIFSMAGGAISMASSIIGAVSAKKSEIDNKCDEEKKQAKEDYKQKKNEASDEYKSTKQAADNDVKQAKENLNNAKKGGNKDAIKKAEANLEAAKQKRNETVQAAKQKRDQQVQDAKKEYKQKKDEIKQKRNEAKQAQKENKKNKQPNNNTKKTDTQSQNGGNKYKFNFEKQSFGNQLQPSLSFGNNLGGLGGLSSTNPSNFSGFGSLNNTNPSNFFGLKTPQLTAPQLDLNPQFMQPKWMQFAQSQNPTQPQVNTTPQTNQKDNTGNTTNSEQAKKTSEEIKNDKKVDAYINGNSSVSNIINKTDGNNTSTVADVAKAVDNVSTNNETSMEALKTQNAKPEDASLLDELKKLTPATISKTDEQIQKEMKIDINDPKTKEMMDDISKKVQTQILADFNKNNKSEKSTLDTISEIIEKGSGASGSLMQLLSSDESEEESNKKYASSGKELLGDKYQNAKKAREADYRRKAKKQVRRINATNAARNVR